MAQGLNYLRVTGIGFRSVIERLLSVALFPFLLSVLSAIACYGASAGPSLGLYLGGLVLVTLLFPPFCMAEESIGDRLIASGAVVIGVSTVWFIGMWHSQTLLLEWAQCTLVLEAYAIALAGLAAALRLARCSAVVSAALSVIVGLAWLTWPIWLSRTWDGESSAAGVARLVM